MMRSSKPKGCDTGVIADNWTRTHRRAHELVKMKIVIKSLLLLQKSSKSTKLVLSFTTYAPLAKSVWAARSRKMPYFWFFWPRLTKVFFCRYQWIFSSTLELRRKQRLLVGTVIVCYEVAVPTSRPHKLVTFYVQVLVSKTIMISIRRCRDRSWILDPWF